MFRKISSLITAVVVIFAALPAIAAMAVTASATLTAGQSVLPGTRDYTVTVRNTEGGMLGIGGAAANYIEIVLPPNLSAPSCDPTVGTFRCRTRNNSVILDSSVLAAGSSLAIPFKATAAKPVDRDRSSQFDVRVSEDAGTTTSSAGRLTTVVRALEILGGTLAATAPTGVIDGTGTAGQQITYTFSVRNYAQQGIEATPSLTSSGNETFGALTPQTIPSDGTLAFAVPVTLGTAPAGGQAARTFTASAISTVDPQTTSGTATGTFTVQASPTLTLAPGSFTPKAVRTDGTSYNFTVNANKAGIPAITGLTGQFTFAGNTVTLKAPTSFAQNAANGIALTFDPAVITGADNVYDAVFTFAGVDDNGFPYSGTQTLNQLITIDNLAPTITLDLRIPTNQQQVKSGDNVSVGVTVQGGGVDFVQLEAAVEGNKDADGNQIITVIPVNNCAAGATSCTATATLPQLGNYGTLRAVGQASDAAENRGDNVSQTFNIDNVIPVLAAPARIVEGGPYGVTRPVVEITISDRFTVAGGCNATNWDVDQTSNDPILVTEVRYSNGQVCSSGTNPNDNIRILVVNSTLDPDIEYNALYFDNRFGIAQTSSRLTDGALNRALDQIVTTVSGIAPALPDLAEVRRNGGAELATFDADRYWVRTAGNDTTATIRNTRASYLIEVLDGNGTVIQTTPVDGANASTPVPVRRPDGSTPDGDYARGIRLVNGNGLRGPVLSVTIALDTALPLFASSAVTATGQPDQVTVSFNEPIWSGSNRAIDWFARERNTNPGEGEFFRYRPDSVTGTQAATRILNVDLANNGDFAGVEFDFDAESAQAGTRYVDRAGNPLGNFAG